MKRTVRRLVLAVLAIFLANTLGVVSPGEALADVIEHGHELAAMTAKGPDADRKAHDHGGPAGCNHACHAASHLQALPGRVAAVGFVPPSLPSPSLERAAAPRRAPEPLFHPPRA